MLIRLISKIIEDGFESFIIVLYIADKSTTDVGKIAPSNDLSVLTCNIIKVYREEREKNHVVLTIPN